MTARRRQAWYARNPWALQSARIPIEPRGPRGETAKSTVITLLVLATIAIPATDDLETRASAVKPTAQELTWLGVPWILSLAEAQNAARAEKRPILLWVSGDDPLERC